MPDKSLSHFLFYLIIILLYFLYDRHQEAERFFKLAVDEQDAIRKLEKAIESQKDYIELLEKKLVDDFYKNSRNQKLNNKFL